MSESGTPVASSLVGGWTTTPAGQDSVTRRCLPRVVSTVESSRLSQSVVHLRSREVFPFHSGPLSDVSETIDQLKDSEPEDRQSPPLVISMNKVAYF